MAILNHEPFCITRLYHQPFYITFFLITNHFIKPTILYHHYITNLICNFTFWLFFPFDTLRGKIHCWNAPPPALPKDRDDFHVPVRWSNARPSWKKPPSCWRKTPGAPRLHEGMGFEVYLYLYFGWGDVNPWTKKKIPWWKFDKTPVSKSLQQKVRL